MTDFSTKQENHSKTDDFTTQLKQVIDRALPDPVNLSMVQLPGLTATKLANIGKALGIEQDSSPPTVGQCRQRAQVYKDVVDDLCKVVTGALPTNLSQEQLAEHFTAKMEALTKLQVALAAANGKWPLKTESVLTLCGYKKNADGVVEGSIPQNMSLMKIIEMANAECKELGIPMAISQKAADWIRAHTDATKERTVDEHHKILGFVEGTLWQRRQSEWSSCWDFGRVISWDRGHDIFVGRKGMTIAPIEGAILTNVLEHVASKGTVDTFNSHKVRTQTPRAELCRNVDGLDISEEDGFYYWRNMAYKNVGCAAAIPKSLGARGITAIRGHCAEIFNHYLMGIVHMVIDP